MLNLFARKIENLGAERDAIQGARYGAIEVAAGQFRSICLRPLPKLVSIFDVLVSGRAYHHLKRGDRALLFYNQPRRSPGYLALTYVLSTRDCTLATLHTGLAILDQVAEIKGSDALVCDAWNWRISERLMARAGWEPHLPSRWHRHYIRRFYGVYPVRGAATRTASLEDAALAGAAEMALLA